MLADSSSQLPGGMGGEWPCITTYYRPRYLCLPGRLHLANSAHGCDFFHLSGLSNLPQGIGPNITPNHNTKYPNGWQCQQYTLTCIGLLDPPVRKDLAPAGLWWGWAPFGQTHVLIHRRLQDRVTENNH